MGRREEENGNRKAAAKSCQSLYLRRIQDLMKGGSDKWPPKALAPRRALGPLKFDFQRFQGQFEVV